MVCANDGLESRNAFNATHIIWCQPELVATKSLPLIYANTRKARVERFESKPLVHSLIFRGSKTKSSESTLAAMTRSSPYALSKDGAGSRPINADAKDTIIYSSLLSIFLDQMYLCLLTFPFPVVRSYSLQMAVSLGKPNVNAVCLVKSNLIQVSLEKPNLTAV